MANYLDPIEATVTAWDDNISAAPHRFNAREFNLIIGNRTVELGHIHNGTLLDILFNMKVRNILIAEGKAQTHQFVPDSGWTSFHVRTDTDVDHALRLLRLSYLLNVARYGRGTYPLDLASEVHRLQLSSALHRAAFPKL